MDKKCPKCKKEADHTGLILHKVWCTASFRASEPASLRSGSMPVERTPPKTAAGPPAPAAARPPAPAAPGPPAPSPQVAPTQQAGAAATTGAAATAGAVVPPDQARLQAEVQALQAQLQAAREREGNLANALKEQSTLIEVEQEKTARAREDIDNLESDLHEIEAERDDLRRRAATPTRHPPLPGTVQAVLDASDKKFEDLIELLSSRLAPPTGQGKTNPAARHLECRPLTSPSSVSLHHYNDWRRLFEMYAEANFLNREPYHARCAYLSMCLHQEWQALIKANDVKWNESQTMAQQLDAIGDWIKLKRHALIDRMQFLSRRQRDSENSEMFLQHLRELFQCTRYGDEVTFPLSENDFRNLILRDLFLCGMQNTEMRKEILKHQLTDLSLEKTIELARNFECAHITSDTLTTKRTQAVRKSTYKQNQSKQIQNRRNADGARPAPGPSASFRPSSFGKGSSPTPHSAQQGANKLHWACESVHPIGQCPVHTHKCANCQRIGHIETSRIQAC